MLTPGSRWCYQFFAHVTLLRNNDLPSPKSHGLVLSYKHKRFGALSNYFIFKRSHKVTWGHLGLFEVIKGHLKIFKILLIEYDFFVFFNFKCLTSNDLDLEWPRMTSNDITWPHVTIWHSHVIYMGSPKLKNKHF